MPLVHCNSWVLKMRFNRQIDCKNKELWHLKASLNDIWSHFSHKKCRSVYDRGVNIRKNTVHTNYEAKRQQAFFKKANTCISNKRCGLNRGFANRTKMFFRAKNKRREITGPWNIGHCDKFILRSKVVLHWLIFQKYGIHSSNTI